jgi:hypothetical protein
MTKSSLMSHYTKEELADLVIMHEKNAKVLNETIDQQYRNAMKLLEDMNVMNKTHKERNGKPPREEGQHGSD